MQQTIFTAGLCRRCERDAIGWPIFLPGVNKSTFTYALWLGTLGTLGVVPLSDILDGPAPEKSMFRGVKDFGFFGTGLVLSSSSVEEFLYGQRFDR